MGVVSQSDAMRWVVVCRNNGRSMSVVLVGRHAVAVVQAQVARPAVFCSGEAVAAQTARGVLLLGAELVGNPPPRTGWECSSTSRLGALLLWRSAGMMLLICTLGRDPEEGELPNKNPPTPCLW